MKEKCDKEFIQLTISGNRQITLPEAYYSGEVPNPNLHTFIESHIKDKPFTLLNDNYEIQPGVGSISTSKRDPIYGLHGYDSKKPPGAIRKYIEHFTNPGDLVLDPFVGSGMTAVAALLSGRKCVAIDLSALATFITAQYCTPVDSSLLSTSAKQALTRAEKAVGGLYSTICGRCGNSATIYFTVFSQTYQCKRCMAKVPLFDAVRSSQSEDDDLEKETFKGCCPKCACRGIKEAISTRQERLGYVPVMIEYECECSPGTHIQRLHNDSDVREREIFQTIDLPKLKKIESSQPDHWFPNRRFMWVEQETGPWGVLWRPYHGDIRRVDQFFTSRNLKALASLLSSIDMETDPRCRTALRFIFSAFVLSQSKLQRYHPGSTFPNMIAPGILYVAPMIKEYNSFLWYEGKVRSALRGFEALKSVNPQEVIVSTQSATNLQSIPSNSVDYIITDPPYSGKIQYGELNFIQEAWLRFTNDWRQDEIIVSDFRGKDEKEWASLMRKAFAECFRTLKPGRWMSVCYHDSSEGTWSLLQDLLAQIGFIPEIGLKVVAIDAREKSLKQITANKVTKRDLVINFRKPRVGEAISQTVISDTEDDATFNDKVRAIIREYLQAAPGASKDLIYDEVVSRMVRAGRMEPHNFDELLGHVAVVTKSSIDGVERWYLASEDDSLDTAETAKEDLAAVRMREFITEFQSKRPGEEGVHYSDVFEHYIYAVTDKPRRQLAEWLLDYFFKTDSGTYRLPSSEDEERLKAESRKKGTIRRIRRYLALLEQKLAIPEKERPSDATLAEWIRHCRKSGLYEQGKALYLDGGLDVDKLPEEVMVKVEEDYDVCVRMLARTEPKLQKKRSKA